LMTASATIPQAIVAGRTLARFAAARRIETATADEQLQLALDYGLLTARTNLLVVHERVAGEKAKDLPELAKVAHMQAAGWHGLGSVRPMVYEKVANCYASLDDLLPEWAGVAESRSAPPSVRRSLRRPDVSLDRIVESLASAPVKRARRATSLAAFIAALERAGPGHLPVTLVELAAAGLPLELVEALTALVSSGHAEGDIVRAVLDAISTLVADRTIRTRLSRHLARECRHQFQAAGECRSLRDEVTAIVRDACRPQEVVPHGY